MDRALARTETLRRALDGVSDRSAVADLLFLEAFEMNGVGGIGATLRATQIMRANPALTAELRAELRMRSSRDADHREALPDCVGG